LEEKKTDQGSQFDQLGILWGNSLPQVIPLSSKRTAEKARRTDRISPNEFFYPIGTFISPLEESVPGILHSFQDLVDQIKQVGKIKEIEDPFSEVLLQKNHDGVLHIVMKSNSGERIYSSDGINRIDRFPSLRKWLSGFPEEVILLVNVEFWKNRSNPKQGEAKREFLPVEFVTSYLNSNSPPDDSNLVLNCIDLLWISSVASEKKDLHKEPIEERMNILQALPFASTTLQDPPSGLNLSPTFNPMNQDTFVKQLRMISSSFGSNGVVVKLKGSPFSLSGIDSSSWILENSLQLKGIVHKILKDSISVALDSSPGMEMNPLSIVRMDDQELVTAGKVLKNGIEVEVGDPVVLKIPCLKLRTDRRTGLQDIEFYAAEIHEVLPYGTRIDSCKDALEKSKGTEMFIEEIMEISEKVASSDISKASPYISNPSEDTSYKYVVQTHFRGKSVHNDLRIEAGGKRFLIGWTLNTQIAGAIKEPVEDMKQARSIISKARDFFKIDWNTGNWRKKSGGDEVYSQISSEQKSIHALPWLKFQGVIEPGETGATKNFPAIIVRNEMGTVEYGAQTSKFNEYFFHGRALSYRIVFRKSDDSSAKAEPPPEHPPKAGSWFAIRPLDQTPYVLSQRSLRSGYHPPPGISALPKAIRSRIPQEFRYWTMKGSKAREVREALIKLISSGELKVIQKQQVCDYVIQTREFQNLVRTRTGSSKKITDLRFDFGSGSLLWFETIRTSRMNLSQSCEGRFSRDAHRDSMSMKGNLKSDHYLNPQDQPAKMEIQESGKVIILQDTPEFKQVEFHGDQLHGIYEFSVEENGLWTMRKTEGVI
jgi:hypothetical protein